MRTAKVIALSYTYLFLIILGMTIFSLMLPTVFGQQPNIPANPATTITAAGVNTNNLKLQEQKGWLYIEPPPGQNIPSAQNVNGLSAGEIGGYIAMGISAYNSWQNKKTKDDQKEIKDVQKDIAAVQVKQITVQEKTLDQVYEGMPNKGNEIKDKPEIKKTEIAKLKEQAVQNTANA